MPPFLATKAAKTKVYGEIYPCCKHCEGQNCDPANEHLAPCVYGCDRVKEPVIVVKPKPKINVYTLMFAAQKRGRWFW